MALVLRARGGGRRLLLQARTRAGGLGTRGAGRGSLARRLLLEPADAREQRDPLTAERPCLR